MRTLNRLAPAGYTYVDRPLAKKLFEDGKPVTMHGNNTNSAHVFDNWRLGFTISKIDDEGDVDDVTDFDTAVAAYVFHLDRELGTYPVFCTPTENI